MGATKGRALAVLLAAWSLLLLGQGPVAHITEFLAGYREAGGPRYLETHITTHVIPCESSGTPSRVSSYGHLGLMQFTPGTWASAGGGDWADPWTQGRNTATWLRYLEASHQSPGSSAGWPGCWWRGGGPPGPAALPPNTGWGPRAETPGKKFQIRPKIP